MAKKLSVDLTLNAQGYTQGINEAKNATAQYTNATKDIKKEQEEYIAQFGSLKKQLGAAKKEAFNLAAAFNALSKTEKESEIGQQMAEDLQIAIEKAAELQDVMADTSDAIKNAASDTAGLDAFKESLEVGKDLTMAYAGAVAKLTGDDKALKDVIATLAMVQGGYNAVIKVTNMLQKNSATMIALQRSGVLSLAQAEKISVTATKAATVATKGLGIAMKALPYVAVASGILYLGKKFVDYMSGANKAVKETKNVEKELTGVKKTLNDVANAFNGSYAQALGKTLSSYRQLQNQYKSLSSEHEKVKWIKENTNKMKELGLSVTGVNDADRILIKQSKDVIESFKLRAQAAAEAARLQDLYVKRIEAETKARQDAGKKQIKAGESVQQGDVDRLGLQKDIDYKQYNNKVGMFYTDVGAMKANQALAANNIRTYTKEIDAEIEASANRLAEAEAKYDEALGNLGLGDSDNKNKTKSEVEVGFKFPDTSKLAAQNKKYFADLAKKTNEQAQAAFNKQKAEFNINLNSHIDEQQINNIVNESKEKTETILNAIKNGIEIEDPFDFSFLSDEAYKEAERLKELADSTLDEMTDIFNEFGNTEEAQAGIAALCDQYNVLIEKLKEYQKENNKNKTFATMAAGAQKAGNYIGGIADAFNTLGDATENEGFKAFGIIAETIANMALSFSKALTQAAELGPWAWIAFGITGMAQLIAMVAQIKSLTAGSYAQGGVIPGNSFTGDKLYAKVNSGERILTAKQNENLEKIANGVGYYQDRGQYTISSVGVQGRELLLVLQNELKVTGKKTIL